MHVRIKADLTCAAVAGASVLAKTERDRLLVELSPAHPQYNFAVNKGYGTPEHLAALRAHGPSRGAPAQLAAAVRGSRAVRRPGRRHAGRWRMMSLDD